MRLSRVNCYKQAFDCLVYPGPRVRTSYCWPVHERVLLWPQSIGNRVSQYYRLVDPGSISSTINSRVQGSHRTNSSQSPNRGGINGKCANGCHASRWLQSWVLTDRLNLQLTCSLSFLLYATSYYSPLFGLHSISEQNDYDNCRVDPGGIQTRVASRGATYLYL